jgi:hypothetical protein
MSPYLQTPAPIGNWLTPADTAGKRGSAYQNPLFYRMLCELDHIPSMPT